MGKRTESDFEKRARDYYPTPIKAVEPLMPLLPKSFSYVEPCAGDGRMINHFTTLSEGRAKCVGAYDIEYPEDDELVYPVDIKDALTLNEEDVKNADFIITNPPWSRDKKSGYILHKMIEHFAELCPTWLLFDADWMHTGQAVPYIDEYLVKVLAVGRVSWADNGVSGKDNAAWYCFDKAARSCSKYPMFLRRGTGK